MKEFAMSGEVIPPTVTPIHDAPDPIIMIVEDDADIGLFLQQLIEEETPYRTIIVDHGHKALEQAPAIRPCLLMLDYRLPGINGLEIYDRLQEDAATRGVPTIMMSATLPTQEIEQRGLFQLHKPMSINHVIRMITHALASFEGVSYSLL